MDYDTYVVVQYRSDGLGFNSWLGEQFFFFTTFKLALAAIQPPIEWLLRILSPG
jgi:hypothetical protein